MVCRTGQWRRQPKGGGGGRGSGQGPGTWQTNSKLLSAYFIVYAYALPTVFAIDFQLPLSRFPSSIYSTFFFTTLHCHCAGVKPRRERESVSLPGLLPATTTNRICVSNWQDKRFGRAGRTSVQVAVVIVIVVVVVVCSVKPQ